jgi:hypothetical protein
MVSLTLLEKNNTYRMIRKKKKKIQKNYLLQRQDLTFLLFFVLELSLLVFFVLELSLLLLD